MVGSVLMGGTNRPMTFFTELATNATKHNVAIVTYVGNDDGISGHFGTQGQPCIPPTILTHSFLLIDLI